MTVKVTHTHTHTNTYTKPSQWIFFFYKRPSWIALHNVSDINVSRLYLWFRHIRK